MGLPQCPMSAGRPTAVPPSCLQSEGHDLRDSCSCPTCTAQRCSRCAGCRNMVVELKKCAGCRRAGSLHALSVLQLIVAAFGLHLAMPSWLTSSSENVCWATNIECACLSIRCRAVAYCSRACQSEHLPPVYVVSPRCARCRWTDVACLIGRGPGETSHTRTTQCATPACREALVRGAQGGVRAPGRRHCGAHVAAWQRHHGWRV